LGRCGVAGFSYLAGFAAMFLAAVSPEARLAATLIAIAAACSMFTLAPSWATAIELGGHHAGVLAAAMNTAGQIGGILSPVILAYIVDAFANWAVPLHVTAGLYLAAAACWIFIRPPAEVTASLPQ